MFAGTLLDIAMNHSESLIEGARNGNSRAVSQLMNLWYKRVYNFAFKYFTDHDLAMEVTQRTFISMSRNITGLKEISRFRPWLYRIVTNYCHEEDRKRKARWVVSTSEADKDAKESEFNPDRQLQRHELAELLLEALNEINPEQREVVIMKEYEGFKFREIADILGISENTAKSRVYYGLDALRKILAKKNINKETIYYEL